MVAGRGDRQGGTERREASGSDEVCRPGDRRRDQATRTLGCDVEVAAVTGDYDELSEGRHVGRIPREETQISSFRLLIAALHPSETGTGLEHRGLGKCALTRELAQGGLRLPEAPLGHSLGGLVQLIHCGDHVLGVGRGPG